ncbi:MAG TPA: hypothetical protein VGC42_01795, partial [Kofleriaceae bacterium]
AGGARQRACRDEGELEDGIGYHCTEVFAQDRAPAGAVKLRSAAGVAMDPVTDPGDCRARTGVPRRPTRRTVIA